MVKCSYPGSPEIEFPINAMLKGTADLKLKPLRLGRFPIAKLEMLFGLNNLPDLTYPSLRMQFPEISLPKYDVHIKMIQTQWP